MNTDIMIDLETLDTTPTATILTLGAVKFDPFGDDSKMEKLYLRIDIDSCDKLGATVSPRTVEWWASQSPAAQEEAFNPDGRVDVADAMSQLYKFCWGAKRVWSHGAAFDVPICEFYFRKLEKAIPWSFWEVRCTRTAFDLGINPNRATVTAHNALEDAIDQAKGVQRVYQTLRRSTMTDGTYINPFARTN